MLCASRRIRHASSGKPRTKTTAAAATTGGAVGVIDHSVHRYHIALVGVGGSRNALLAAQPPAPWPQQCPTSYLQLGVGRLERFGAWALDIDELDVKHERRVRRNHTASAARAVRHMRWDLQLALLANAHVLQALVPAADHAAGAKHKVLRQ